MSAGRDLRPWGVAIRVHVPGHLVTAHVGRVHLLRYPDTITLEIAMQAQEDYAKFAREQGGAPGPLLMIVERPFPMPSMDVRSYWRGVAKDPPGFEAIALVVGGVVGLMAAAVTHLGEQLVAVLGVRFRTFTEPFDAADWLCDAVSCEAEADELMEVIRQLRAAE
jgi:hypothetical protein